MGMVSRKTTEFRWFCTNKELCAEIDDGIADLTWGLANLNKYVLSEQAKGMCNAGLTSISLAHRFTEQLNALKKHRAKLWRRVTRVVEEMVDTEQEMEAIDGNEVQGNSIT